jgi:NMD protein affecting ribosome stability and mRNA decay
MIAECPRCGKDNELEEGSKREDAFCYSCFASLREVEATVVHNQAEIEKLKWQQKSPSN